MDMIRHNKADLSTKKNLLIKKVEKVIELIYIYQEKINSFMSLKTCKIA